MDRGFAGINSIKELRQFFPIDIIDCAVDLEGQATPVGEIFAILRIYEPLRDVFSIIINYSVLLYYFKNMAFARFT